MKSNTVPKQHVEGEKITGKPAFYGIRHTLAITAFFGIVCLYAMRISLSITILAMTKDDNPNQDSISIEETTEGCPIPQHPNLTNVDIDVLQNTGEFDWDEETRGLVLSSLFYGYILTNILGGRAAEYFGGRRVAGAGVVLSGLFTMGCPIAARLSVWALMAMRFLQGVCDGITVPAIMYTIARWYPKNERSKFTTIIMSGIRIGSVIAMAISGWLCSTNFYGGWPSVFYVFGGMGVLWSCFWFWLITDDPREHRRITDEELTYIVKGCPIKESRSPVPWLSIFTSKYFWVIAIAHIGNNWGLLMFLTQLPTYLEKILHFKISQNGMLSSLPFLGTWLFGNVFSLFIDRLLDKGIISVLTLRRLSTAVSYYGTMLGMIAMFFINCEPTLVIVVLIISISCTGCVFGGFTSSHADLSPRFAGTLFGLTNTIAAIPAFLAPVVVGILTKGNQTLFTWKIVFLITAAVYAITATIYITVITTEVQPWNDPVTIENKKSEKDQEKV